MTGDRGRHGNGYRGNTAVTTAGMGLTNQDNRAVILR